MKRLIKRAVENAIALLAPLLWRFQRRPRLLVLMYHRVLPPDHPDIPTEQPGMFVSPRTFAMHLRMLRERGFEFVQLDEWLSANKSGQKLPTRACAVTFDDGWRDNYDYAYPVLKQVQVPATIFLVSDLVGTRYSFWPNSLARILARRGLGTQDIDSTIMRYKLTHSDEQMRQIVAAEGEADALERDLMSWAEIEEMKASGLVRFGSHTRRHTRLANVGSTDMLRDEIVGSGEAIAAQLGAQPQTFCYPNGDTSPQAIDIVRSAYRGAVTTQNGWHLPHQDPFLIRRIGVHEDISNRPASFLARVSGWI